MRMLREIVFGFPSSPVISSVAGKTFVLFRFRSPCTALKFAVSVKFSGSADANSRRFSAAFFRSAIVLSSGHGVDAFDGGFCGAVAVRCCQAIGAAVNKQQTPSAMTRRRNRRLPIDDRRG